LPQKLHLCGPILKSTYITLGSNVFITCSQYFIHAHDVSVSTDYDSRLTTNDDQNDKNVHKQKSTLIQRVGSWNPLWGIPRVCCMGIFNLLMVYFLFAFRRRPQFNRRNTRTNLQRVMKENMQTQSPFT
jgi:hypothetical protein